MKIRKWLPVVEDYAKTCADGDCLRTVSSYLHGKPRSYFQSKYDAYKAANGGAEPANFREFFRETVTLNEIRCSSARRVRKPRLAFQQT
jgi:hypothetical protein